MTKQASGRVDPRALLRLSQQKDMGAIKTGGLGGAARLGVIGLGAAVGLAAFGTFVVNANDDAGALAFIRAQTRPRAAQVEYAPPRAAYPVSYYAPRAFFPTAQPSGRRTQTAAPAPQGQNTRNSPVVASYAPFSGLFPADSTVNEPKRQQRVSARSAAPAAARPTLAAPFAGVGEGNGARGNRVSYCVRTCDGYFFPLSNSTGSDRGDEAACNRLCPTAETKIYIGQIGTEVDDARARQNGRRYAQMPNAFAYRTSFNKDCSCNASGAGLTDASIFRDQTLKVGDVVMTAKGMRVFIGGQFPYREANFTTIDRSRQIAGGSRETLRTLEQASMPGRSGVTQRASQRKSDELADLRRASEALRTPEQVVRYVGPDRTATTR
jgi:hypothetical protein